MKTNYAGDGFSKTLWGKLSWALGLAAILMFCLGLYAPSGSARLGEFAVYLSAILNIAGLFSGFMGLFTTRAWVGLILNLLLAVFEALLFIYFFGFCCAPANLI